jgi:hypothetical protein
MDKVNKSIGCNVSECKYHAKDAEYCSLDHIKVVHHHHPANTVECTDCGSFESEMK